jgi:uncharacterized delta-60 repeat protein
MKTVGLLIRCLLKMDLQSDHTTRAGNAAKVLVALCVPALVFVQLLPLPTRAFTVCTLQPGQITTDFFGGGFDDDAYASALQADGKIVLVGSASNANGNYFGLSRYDTNGSLDSSFGSGGKVTSQISSGDIAQAVALQTDGKIVVAGQTLGNGNPLDFRVSRFNANGALDTTFGDAGSVTADFQNFSDNATAVAIQSDGKIVVAGSTGAGGGNIAMLRCNPNGSLDATFGSGGKVITALDKVDSVSSMAIQPDGKIVVGGGFPNVSTHDDFLIVRFNINGSLDDSFGTNGVTTTDFFSGPDSITAIQLQPDGKIIAAGVAQDGTDGKAWGLARYNTDGTLDPTFGAGSGRTIRFVGDGSQDTPTAVRLQQNGRIVVGGFCIHNAITERDFAVARYNTDGTVDMSFGIGGETTTDFCQAFDGATGLLVQTDGKIVATGIANLTVTGEDFALVRYNTDGSLDSTFTGINPPTFNYCMRDNTTGNFLQLNSTTGAYLLTRCKDGFTLAGTGKVQVVGSIVTLSDKRTNCVVSAGFNTGQRTGSATITLTLAPGIMQTIKINATNPYAACSCAG